MSYTSKSAKPNEYASKSSHTYIINDKSVIKFLQECNLPKKSSEIDFNEIERISLTTLINNPITNIITVDGGYTEIFVDRGFPSSTLTFFQFGANQFSINDLNDLQEKPFIDPDDMTKLKTIERLKLVIPTKNIILKNEGTFTKSVRRVIHDFFLQHPDKNNFMDTLKWFVFEEYNTTKNKVWNLSSCPNLYCEERNIKLIASEIGQNYMYKCPVCGEEIFLTDIFRLHEVIDDEYGAGGIMGYITTLIEQIVLIHFIRLLLSKRASAMNEILFIKDGPLAFFGQTANMHKPMRSLVKFLFEKHNLYLVGVEKSGPFVEHANEISSKIKPGEVLILNNDYIYKYILLGKADNSRPYGSTTYYGNKVIFKSNDDKLYVISLPTTNILASPNKNDFKNFEVILSNVQKLKCDMYDDSLFPVALVNKLVSLADYPSSKILERFAQDNIG